MVNKKKRTEYGYISLISTLVIGAVASVVVLTMLWLSIVGAQNNQIRKDGFESRVVADACSEYALQQIRNDGNITGTGTLNIGNGSCSYTITTGGGESRTIESQGVVGETEVNSVITITAIYPLIQIANWSY